MKKRIISIVLAICMVLTLVPATAFAEGETDNTPSVSAYATKEQLMDDTFAPDSSSGTATNIGKLVFGKNGRGASQEWYILGQDDQIKNSGGDVIDNTIIFAASPITTEQAFENDTQNNKTYDPAWGCSYIIEISEVFPNHYGASDLRATLQSIAASTSYFTTAEQRMMNATALLHYDNKKSFYYNTSDKLYALNTESDRMQYIYAGSMTGIRLAMNSYWNNGDYFWLRSSQRNEGNSMLACYANPGNSIQSWLVDATFDVRPAGNLNLSNVLFASAAKASSNGVASGTIESGKAMTLRMDGSGKSIGTARYNDTEGVIAAKKDSNATTPVSLVVQGKDGTKDWYYSMQLKDSSETYISKGMIKVACGLSDVSLDDCKIWLETTDDSARMTYATMATQETWENLKGMQITQVSLTGVIPTPGQAFPSTCKMQLPISTHDVTYTTNESGVDVPVTGTVEWDKTYKAKIEIGTFMFYSSICYFDSSVYVKIDGEALPEHLSPNVYGVLTITKEFTTEKRKSITGVNSPSVPTGNTFTNYYGYDGYEALPVNSSELGTQATVAVLDKQDNTTQNKTMNVTWTIANDGGTGYDKTPGATNTFRWTIPASALAGYDVTSCPGYDSSTGTITGTVSVANKAAAPVTITGTDSSIAYTGEDIDVSQYFTIDSNAGTSTYSLITGAEEVTGEGTLSGSKLSVTKTGTFKIKVNTAANGIYAAGEKTITLTVDNGTIRYTASDYSGIYDGQPHSIGVNVSTPSGAIVTYSTDGTTYDNANPSYVDEGTYTVHYRIQKNNYDTVEGSKTVTINKKAVSITAQAQSIMWGNTIDQGAYSVSENGIATSDRIAEITLTPSTTELTDDGTISINNVKIENTAKRDVTGNYDLTLINGTLEITHNTSLAPASIDAVKTKTSYIAGETLNVDDITVTVYYADGYSEEVSDYTINVDDIDMSTAEYKTLTVTYTKNGGTETDDIIITVSPEIIEGIGQSVTAGEKKDLTFRSNAAFSDFIRIEVDGKTIDEKNYSVNKEDSTVVTLKADYVATLSAGEHTINIVSETGTATAIFTVAKVNDPTGGNPTGNNPNTSSVNHVSQTGDNSMMLLWIALLLVSGGMLTLMGIYYKKKKYNR